MAPPGYVALGYVANRGLSHPNLDVMKCVHVKVAVQSTIKAIDKQGMGGCLICWARVV